MAPLERNLNAAVPDHSTFSKNRQGRYRESDAFRHLFESVLRRCMSKGRVGGEGFAIDASVIKADDSRDPELIIRMLIVDYCVGIRSERRLWDDSLEFGVKLMCRARSPSARPAARAAH